MNSAERRTPGAMAAPICRTEGCKQEAIFRTINHPGGPQNGPHPQPGPGGFYPGFGGGGTERIPSKYCLKHTCEHFFRQEACPNKKPHYDAVCISHTRCPVQNCPQGRSQYQDPDSDPSSSPKFLRRECCSDHTCTAPLCQSRRLQMPHGGPLLPFCQKHHCRVEGCKKRCLESRTYCVGHKCGEPECQQIVEGNHALCRYHVQCEMPGCKRSKHEVPHMPWDHPASDKDDPHHAAVGIITIHPPPAADGGGGEFFVARVRRYHPSCFEHAICLAEGCDGFRVGSSLHCEKHSCAERHCNNLSGGKAYCNAHRCQYESCDNPTAVSKKPAKKDAGKGPPAMRREKERDPYCGLHTCRKNNCLASVSDLQLYCDKHRCSKKACVAERVAEELCLTHLKKQSETAGETKAKAEMDEWKLLFRERDDPPARLLQHHLPAAPAPGPARRSPDFTHGGGGGIAQVL